MVPYMILQMFDPRQKDETRFKILVQIFYNIAITAATLYIFKTKGKFYKIKWSCHFDGHFVRIPHGSI